MMPQIVPSWVANSTLVVGVLTFFGVLIRLIGPWSRQIAELEARMREELRSDKVRCEAELRVVKHRERNSRQLVYSLLRILDMPETERKAMLDRVRDDLERIEQAEAVESAVISTGGRGFE